MAVYWLAPPDSIRGSPACCRRPAAATSKRERLDLVVGEVIELAGGPRLVRRTSRQTPSADWTLSSMKMHLQSASAGHCCTATAGGGTERGRVISAAHLVPRVLPKAGAAAISVDSRGSHAAAVRERALPVVLESD